MQCNVFSVASLDPPRNVALTTWYEPPPPTREMPLIYIVLMGVRSDKRLLARLDAFTNGDPPPVSPPIEFVDFGLGPHTAPPHHVMITPPRTRNRPDVVLSPDGRRLAWLVTGEDITHVNHPFGSYHEDDRTTFLGTQEVWVSRVDGTRMKRLGWLLTHPYSGDGVDAEALRWTPDGKHLSFIYRDGLYIVPVH